MSAGSTASSGGSAAERIGIKICLRSYDGLDRGHAHDFHQIVLPVEGALAMAVGNGAEGLVRTGTGDGGGWGVLVAAGTPHRFRAAGENRFVVLDLPADGGELPNALLGQVWNRPFFPLDEGLGRLAGWLAFEARVRALDATTVRHAGALLLGALERRCAGNGSARTDKALDRAVAHIHRHFAGPVQVADLARAAGLSPGRLHERFRRGIGCTPGEYLARIRLDRAEDLLRRGMPPAEVAPAVGYSDQSALTRSLRRRRGTTPARLKARGGLEP